MMRRALQQIREKNLQLLYTLCKFDINIISLSLTKEQARARHNICNINYIQRQHWTFLSQYSEIQGLSKPPKFRI